MFRLFYASCISWSDTYRTNRLQGGPFNGPAEATVGPLRGWSRQRHVPALRECEAKGFCEVQWLPRNQHLKDADFNLLNLVGRDFIGWIFHDVYVDQPLGIFKKL